MKPCKTTKKRLLSLIFSVLLVCCMLIGCGNSDKYNSSTEAPAGTSTARKIGDTQDKASDNASENTTTAIDNSRSI